MQKTQNERPGARDEEPQKGTTRIEAQETTTTTAIPDQPAQQGNRAQGTPRQGRVNNETQLQQQKLQSTGKRGKTARPAGPNYLKNNA